MPDQFPPPPDETEAGILRLVTRTYPIPDPRYAPALRMALGLGWSAGLATSASTKEIVNG